MAQKAGRRIEELSEELRLTVSKLRAHEEADRAHAKAAEASINRVARDAEQLEVCVIWWERGAPTPLEDVASPSSTMRFFTSMVDGGDRITIRTSAGASASRGGGSRDGGRGEAFFAGAARRANRALECG